MQTFAATVENSMGIPQKIKNRPAFDLVIPLLGVYLKNPKHYLKEHKHLYIHCSIIYSHQDMKAAQVSISRWVDKITMGRLYNEYYSAIKKKKYLPFETVWMDLEHIMLSEISQWEKDKYHMISLICGI